MLVSHFEQFAEKLLLSAPLLGLLLYWLDGIENDDRFKRFVKPIQVIDRSNLKLEHILRVLSSQLFHLPLPPVSFLELSDTYFTLLKVKSILVGSEINEVTVITSEDNLPYQLEDVIHDS